MKKNKILGILIVFLVTITGCDCTKNPPPPNPPADTQAPSVPTGLAGVATTSSVSLSWNASSDNVAVTGYKVYRGGVQIATTSSTTYTDNGLTPNTQYSYTVSAYDAAGNNSSQSVAQVVTTLLLPNQNSSWFSQPTITYTSPVAGMIGNTVSNEFKIRFENTSSSAQMLRSGRINFGTTAIKMIRYQPWSSLNGTGWDKLTAINGTIIFNDLWLNPGVTELRSVFSLKEVVGVPNGTSINISFDQMLDAQGMEKPIGGSWQAPVAAGTVDATTQATKFTTEWLGYMAQSPLSLNPGGSTTGSNYLVSNVKVSGPGNARVASIKLRNPYGNSLLWNNSSWRTNFGGPDYVVSANWNGDYVKLTMPSDAIISNTSFTSFMIFANVQNASTTTTFNSGATTPGLFGLELKSKYDLEIVNSSGQVLDLSEVVVKQGVNTVSN